MNKPQGVLGIALLFCLVARLEASTKIYLEDPTIDKELDAKEGKLYFQGFVQSLMEVNEVKKLDYLFLDDSSQSTALKKLMFDLSTGKEKNANGLEINYQYMIQVEVLSDANAKAKLTARLVEKGVIVRQSSLSFDEFQANYYLSELAKSILIPNYKPDLGKAPESLKNQQGKLQIKVESAIASELPKFQYNLKENIPKLFKEELGKVMQDADTLFRSSEYLSALGIYKGIYKKINEDSTLILEKEKTKLNQMLQERMASALKMHFNQKINEFNISIKKEGALDSESSVNSSLQTFRQIRSNYKQESIPGVKIESLDQMIEEIWIVMNTLHASFPAKSGDAEYFKHNYNEALEYYKKSQRLLLENQLRSQVIDEKIQTAITVQESWIANKVQLLCQGSNDALQAYDLNQKIANSLSVSITKETYMGKALAYQSQSKELLKEAYDTIVESKNVRSYRAESTYSQSLTKYYSMAPNTWNPPKQLPAIASNYGDQTRTPQYPRPQAKPQSSDPLVSFLFPGFQYGISDKRDSGWGWYYLLGTYGSYSLYSNEYTKFQNSLVEFDNQEVFGLQQVLSAPPQSRVPIYFSMREIQKKNSEEINGHYENAQVYLFLFLTLWYFGIQLDNNLSPKKSSGLPLWEEEGRQISLGFDSQIRSHQQTREMYNELHLEVKY